MANVNKVKRDPVLIQLDKERSLKFTLNSFAEMEDKYGTIDDALEAVQKGSIKAIRFVLWAGLIHEDDDLTEKQVGAMIELQDLEELGNRLGAAMQLDLPEKGDNPN